MLILVKIIGIMSLAFLVSLGFSSLMTNGNKTLALIALALTILSIIRTND